MSCEVQLLLYRTDQDREEVSEEVFGCQRLPGPKTALVYNRAFSAASLRMTLATNALVTPRKGTKYQ